MSIKPKPDIRLEVTITSEKRIINDILCYIFLPKRVSDPIELYLYPTKEQMKWLFNFHEVSLHGEIKNGSNVVLKKVQAKKAYLIKKSSTTTYFSDISENYVSVYVYDLEITSFLKKRSM